MFNQKKPRFLIHVYFLLSSSHPLDAIFFSRILYSVPKHVHITKSYQQLYKIHTILFRYSILLRSSVSWLDIFLTKNYTEFPVGIIITRQDKLTGWLDFCLMDSLHLVYIILPPKRKPTEKKKGNTFYMFDDDSFVVWFLCGFFFVWDSLSHCIIANRHKVITQKSIDNRYLCT